jgi:hypothetical protein
MVRVKVGIKMVAVAEQIKTSLDSITNWKETSDTALLGLVFGKNSPSVLDDLITTYANANQWIDVARVAALARTCGYHSPTIEDKIKLFLTNMPMFSSAPVPINSTYDGGTWFEPELNVVMSGYLWARRLNHEKERWDSQKAYDKLIILRANEAYPFSGINVDTGATYRQFPTGRWHESSGMINTFRHGVHFAVNADIWELLEWRQLNEIFWLENHYNYSPSYPNWDMHAPLIHFATTKLHVNHMRMLAQFYRVVNDTELRYLHDGWGSPQWGGYNVIVRHYPSNLQRVLDQYLPTIGLLQTLYPTLSDDGKSKFKGMLNGTIAPRMADGLLASDLYVAPRFKLTSDAAPSDAATAYGCAILFLMGIIPDTGSLAVPVRQEGMGEVDISFLDSVHFSFNYANKEIKIPVYAGSLNFMYGTTPVTVAFPYDGIYTVKFSDDWNKVTSTQWVGELKADYLQAPTPPPSVTTQLAALTVSVAGLGATTPLMRKALETAKEKGKEAVRRE